MQTGNEARSKQIGAWTAAAGKDRETGHWILDSGATHHMCSEEALFLSLRSHEAKISIANGGRMNATGMGEVKLTVWNGKGVKTPIRLQNVLYVPGLGPNNLISVRCIQQAGGMIVFGGSGEHGVSICHDGLEVGVARLKNNSYILSAQTTENPSREISPITANQAQETIPQGTLIEWHERLGHLGFDDIKQLAKNDTDIQVQGPLTTPVCESCQLGKQTRKPNSNPATHRTTGPLELIHSDLAGPMATTSLGGAKYFLLFIDDYSRYTTVYTIRNKSAVIDCFRNYKAEVENQYSQKIKRFQSDGGGEYTSTAFSKLLLEAGIVREQTAPYSPEQNGVSERVNRTIIGRAKPMLFAAGLPDEMWGEAVHTAVYLKNRSPTSALQQCMTPLEAFTGARPKLGALIPFGAKGYNHIPKELRRKWEPNSIPCTFTGYAGTNQFRVLINRRIHVTRDLTLVKEAKKTILEKV